MSGEKKEFRLFGLTGPVILLGIVVIGGVGMLIGRGTRPKEPTTTTSGGGVAGASSDGVIGAHGPQHFDLTEDPHFTAGAALRPMDRDIFAALANPNLERTALPDLFPDRPYKVRVVGSVSEHRFGGVMIDLERNGSWDERWQLKGDEVFRAVPKDPTAGGEPVQYNLAKGRWQAH